MRVPVRLRLGYRWQGEYRWRTYELDADGEPVLVGQAAGADCQAQGAEESAPARHRCAIARLVARA
jgi:hypothetical protein